VQIRWVMSLFALLAAPAGAQEPAGGAGASPAAEGEPPAAEPRRQPARRGQVEQITVTARKREESLQQTPVSVTAFTAEDLDRQSIDDISELTWQTPNFELRPTPVSKSQAAITMRGLEQIDAAPTLESPVGIYLDGIYMHPLTGALFHLLDIERIEVLKGPQGTLFGRNTTGGAVNVITRSPDGSLGATLQGTLGSFNQRDFKGAVSFPILGETLSARLTYLTLNHEPYRDDYFGSEDDQESEQINGGRVKLRWIPTENFDVVLGFDRFEDHGGVSSQQDIAVNTSDFIGGQLASFLHGPAGTNKFAQFGVTSIAGLLDDDPDKVGVDYPTKDRVTIYGYNATITWDLGQFTIKSISGYRKIGRSLRVDFDGFPVNIFHADGRLSSRNFNQEILVSGAAFGERLNWTTGGNYFTEDAYSDSFRRMAEDSIQFGFPAVGAPPAAS
jgi:iron complex outermembrane receptor protein